MDATITPLSTLVTQWLMESLTFRFLLVPKSSSSPSSSSSLLTLSISSPKSSPDSSSAGWCDRRQVPYQSTRSGDQSPSRPSWLGVSSSVSPLPRRQSQFSETCVNIQRCRGDSKLAFFRGAALFFGFSSSRSSVTYSFNYVAVRWQRTSSYFSFLSSRFLGLLFLVAFFTIIL